MNRKEKYVALAVMMMIAVLAMGQSFSNYLMSGYTARSKPATRADSSTTIAGSRFGRYGESYVNSIVSTTHTLADEGSYFTAIVSVGSSQLYDAANSTSFSATKAVLALNNNDIAGAAAKRIYIDNVKLFNWTNVPTSSLSVNMAVSLDNTSRAPTANNGSMTINNVNMDDGSASIARAYYVNAQVGAGMTVPAAGTAVRQVTQCMLRSAIAVVRDSLECWFGAPGGNGGSVGTTGGRVVVSGAPIVIGPQQWALFHVWFPSAAAASVAGNEFELSWWER